MRHGKLAMRQHGLRAAAAAGGFGLLLTLAGCNGGGGDSDDGRNDNGGTPAVTGKLSGIPVQGLTYRTASESGITDTDGSFRYRPGETVTFAVGSLELGSAPAGESVSPVALVEGADSLEHRAVNNIAAFLQTLDHDGNLNNGIQITAETAETVSTYADAISFDQPTADFAASTPVTELLAALNAAGTRVFDDTDPRPRRLRKAQDARENLQRALSERRVVDTSYGQLRGFSTSDGRAWGWYGVPYATPPIGDLRWKPPVAPQPWEGIRDAIAWGDQAAQPELYEQFGEGGMSEDSLYLNVTVPKGYDGEPLPVMVWFHGGGFEILTGNTKSFNNTSLPSQGVIVVTVVHRLGPFGYFAHPALTEESEHASSGNYGQLDLIAALRWVRQNIANFGGDRNNITIFGESGGGGKVLSLLHSPLAQGLFHKAIVQSGMAEPSDPVIPVQLTLEQQEQEGQRLVEALGLQDEEDLLGALRAAPWTELARVSDQIGFAARPNIDGWYKRQGIRQAFEAGAHHDVPIMAGANTGDMPGLIDGFRWYMPWLADANRSEVFAYVFSHVPAGWRAANVPAYHGIELVYVFDYPGSFLSHYLLGLTGHETPTPQKFMTVDAPAPDPNEYALVSSRTMAMWAAFARTGNPSIEGLTWPAYTAENDTYMEIGTTQQTRVGIDAAFPAPEQEEP